MSAQIALICLAWGGNFLASAHALKHFPPFLFTALRLLIVLLALIPVLRRPPPGTAVRLTIIGFLIGAVHFGLNFVALRLAGDISSTAIALQSYVPFTAILAVVFLGERLALTTIVGIAVAFAGVLVLGFDPLVLDAPAALLLTLAAAFSQAVGTILMRRLQGVGALELQAWTALLGMPALLLASLFAEHDQLAAVMTASLLDWSGVLYSALIASLVGHGLLAKLVQTHPVSTVTPYLVMTPVVAVGLGVFVWGDKPGPKLFLGGAMVIAGVLVIALRRPNAMQRASR